MRIRVKICGITNPDDALDAAEAGADAVGLNFHPGSPRSVSPEMAATVCRQLPPFVEAVGVVVNQPLAKVIALVRPLARVHTIQWHGDDHSDLDDPAPYGLIPAFAVSDRDGIQRVRQYLDLCRSRDRLPAAILVDGHAVGQYGGTGRSAPWELLAGFRPDVPLILAGGLTADNVAEAIRVVRPYAVDVATGVESSPGRKDRDKVRRFIDNAREAFERMDA
jgi:phosphoribosylanthranilate isomerase